MFLAGQTNNDQRPILPNGWEISTIGDTCEAPQYGYTASAVHDAIGPRMLRITDIQDGCVDWPAVPYCECDAIDRDKYALQRGDILVARIGATTGKTYIITSCPPSVFASYLIRIRPRAGVDPAFLFYFMNSRDYWRQVDRDKDDKLKGGINAPVLRRLSHCVPPIAEQRSIAVVLGKLQAVMVAQQALIDRTIELKAALLAKLFAEGTRGEPQKETVIGPLPNSWDLRSVRDVADLFSGGTPSKSAATFWSGQIPWASPKDMKKLRLHDVTDHISQAGLDDGSRLAPAKAIFIVIRGMILAKDVPIAMAAVPMAFNQDMKALVTKDNINADYLLHALQASKGRLSTHITTAGHGTRRIDTESISGLQIPIPDPAEQSIIAGVFDHLDNKRTAAERRKQLYSELFSAMLDELMTGRIRVNELDLCAMGISTDA